MIFHGFLRKIIADKFSKMIDYGEWFVTPDLTNSAGEILWKIGIKKKTEMPTLYNNTTVVSQKLRQIQSQN